MMENAEGCFRHVARCRRLGEHQVLGLGREKSATAKEREREREGSRDGS